MLVAVFLVSLFLSFSACLESETRGPERTRNNREGTGTSVRLEAAWNGSVAETTIGQETHFLTAEIHLAKTALIILSCLLILFPPLFLPPTKLNSQPDK